MGARGRWREEDILMNDIWSSADGVTWELVNPGCDVPQVRLHVCECVCLIMCTYIYMCMSVFDYVCTYMCVCVCV